MKRSNIRGNKEAVYNIEKESSKDSRGRKKSSRNNSSSTNTSSKGSSKGSSNGSSKGSSKGASARADRYITKLAEDLRAFREREASGQKISARERKNMRARELRVMKRMKKEAEPLIKQANRVYEMLEEEGSKTIAQQRVHDDFSKMGRFFFTVDDAKTYQEIVDEITRASSYLNSPETNRLTSRRETRNSELYEKYSSQLDSLKNNTYLDSGLIATENDAKEIFANYRRIESYKAALIGKQGDNGVYGSENLILYMIDVHNRGEDELYYGQKALDEFEVENLPQFKEMFNARNTVTGISGLFEKGVYYGKLEGLL